VLLLSGPLLNKVQGIAISDRHNHFDRIFWRDIHAQASKFCWLVSLQGQSLSLLGITLPAYACVNGKDLDLTYAGLGEDNLWRDSIDILLTLGQKRNLAGQGGNEEEGVHCDLLIKKQGRSPVFRTGQD